MIRLRKDDFDSLVGQVFVVHANDGNELAIRLTRIEEKHLIENYESFSLIFKAPEDAPPLVDNSYELENAQFGKAVIFLSATPMADSDPTSYYYESVFNVYTGEDK